MDLDQIVPASLAYLVHDIDDAAVRRRIDLFAAEGFVVGLAGFYRRHQAHAGARGDRVVNLGRTTDAKLARRILAVLRHFLSPGAIEAICRDAPVIVARNLEMLALAWRVRGKEQRLVYECLDVHRLMLGRGGKSRVLRWLERKLLARTDLVIVSSPAFAKEYFEQRQGRSDRVLLVENKVPETADAGYAAGRRSRPLANASAITGRPLVIGWFGMLRCRRTLQQLLTLVEAAHGRIEVMIAGMPSPAEFPDFAADLRGISGVVYRGPYKPQQLAELYAGVDFVWAVDYFEEGLNSDWLLPNRLYEGLAHGAVPIALRKVETGRWLQRRGVGVLVDDPVAELEQIFAALTVDQLDRMRRAVIDLPDPALYQTAVERAQIADAVAGRARG